MRLVKVLIIGILIILIVSFVTKNFSNFERINGLEIPCGFDQAIHHKGYSLSYNEDHEQANWVAYELTKKELRGRTKRTNKFLEDPNVQTGSANDQDYEGSGYDRGHLAPASDMKYSREAMKESFYYSNMSPQEAGFNRGIWKELEEDIRKWAKKFRSLYIVSGPILVDDLNRIGINQVSVPDYYFKALLCYNKQEKMTIGFIIPNRKSSKPIDDYAVTIDAIEARIDVDLFCKLPADQEEKLESTFDINDWK